MWYPYHVPWPTKPSTILGQLKTFVFFLCVLAFYLLVLGFPADYDARVHKTTKLRNISVPHPKIPVNKTSRQKNTLVDPKSLWKKQRAPVYHKRWNVNKEKPARCLNSFVYQPCSSSHQLPHPPIFQSAHAVVVTIFDLCQDKYTACISPLTLAAPINGNWL